MLLVNPPYQKAIPIFAQFPDIQVVFLFGSMANGNIHKESDIDFGFLAERNTKEELSTELIKAGFCNFSLVYIPEANLSMQFEIIRWNKILYEKVGFDTSSFISRIVRMYKDIEYYYIVQAKIYKESFLNEYR